MPGVASSRVATAVSGLWKATTTSTRARRYAILVMNLNIFQSMMPITVTEVGRGFVKGTDRIITSASGTFGFSSSNLSSLEGSCACLELFGPDGALVKRWSVNAAEQFDVRVTGGKVVVATPSCKQCGEV